MNYRLAAGSRSTHDDATLKPLRSLHELKAVSPNALTELDDPRGGVLVGHRRLALDSRLTISLRYGLLKRFTYDAPTVAVARRLTFTASVGCKESR